MSKKTLLWGLATALLVMVTGGMMLPTASAAPRSYGVLRKGDDKTATTRTRNCNVPGRGSRWCSETTRTKTSDDTTTKSSTTRTKTSDDGTKTSTTRTKTSSTTKTSTTRTRTSDDTTTRTTTTRTRTSDDGTTTTTTGSTTTTTTED